MRIGYDFEEKTVIIPNGITIKKLLKKVKHLKRFKDWRIEVPNVVMEEEDNQIGFKKIE